VIDPMEWFWCDMCQEPAIECGKCGYSSCSGCGCEACRDHFAEALKIIEEGKAPERTFLPVRNLKSEVDRFFASSRESGDETGSEKTGKIPTNLLQS